MKRTKKKTQVDNAHYMFQTYSSERRFVSYYHQVKNAFTFIDGYNAKSILVAGKGDGVVPHILQAYAELFKLKLRVDTYDFAADLNPTYLGDLLDIQKVVTKKYDVIICCQVLEHLPFEEAIRVLRQMRKVAKFLVISLPYKAFTVRGSFKVPVLPEFDFCIKLPIIRKKGMVDDRHYWELGCSISVDNFRSKLEQLGFTVADSYILKKHGNHYFFILK